MAENKIFQMRSNSFPDKLQIVIDVENKPNFNAFALSSPARVVVDVKAIAAHNYKNNLTFKKRGVTLIRTGIRNKNEVRLVLDLNRDYRWEAYSLPAENGRNNRVVIDVFDGVLTKKSTVPVVEKIGSISLKNKPIKNTNSTVVKSTIIPGEVVLESVSDSEPRVVVNTNAIPKKKPNVIASKKKPVKAPIETKKIKIIKSDNVASIGKNSPRETTAKRLNQREIVVVIDPGHGGKDSGALGKNRTKEKDVVLQIAKRLKRKIDAISGMRAVLTRSNDRYIRLRGRLSIARKHKADLFVSIHADAAQRRSARGSSVYILSNRGATSESARWLAKRENAVDLKYGVDIGDYDKDIGNVLVQIQQDATIESSNLLANKTLRRMKGIGKLHKRRVERAGFAVLKSPDIPSMLVETAFISNPQEEKRLKSSSHQEKIANSIAKGIQDYFKEHLPQHLLLIEANN